MKNRGSITLEATVSLTAFLFCIMFFLNFARVYMAQNIVAYGAMEASMQFSMDYCKAAAYGSSNIGGFVAEIMGIFANGEDYHEDAPELEAGDIFMLNGGGSQSRIENYFAKSITGNMDEGSFRANADECLMAVGIEHGMDGLDFSGTALLNSQNKIQVNIRYRVKLLVPFLGISEIEMEQKASNRLWKYTKWS